jgi:hypothetical protein
MQQRMKWFIAVGLCLFGCSQGPALATEAVRLQPSAQVSTTDGVPQALVLENEFDFGEMTGDRTYVHAFRITNNGTGVLEITKVMPG